MAITPTSTTPVPGSTTRTVQAAGQGLISAMGAGSGVDIQSLAKNLVDASFAASQQAIEKKISQSQARISGYGAINSMLNILQEKFAALDQSSELNNITTSSSASAVSATVTGNPQPGSHSISVTQLAQGHRQQSTLEYSLSDPVGDGPFQVTVGSTTVDVTVASGATVSDLVAAMNRQGRSAGLVVQLVHQGAAATNPDKPYRLVVTGPTGASNTVGVQGLSLQELDPPQSPRNAELTVNGIAVHSASNTVTKAVQGLSLQLTGTTGTTAAQLQVNRDTSGVVSKVKDLVNAYNQLDAVLSEVRNPNSQVEEFGATLVGDSVVDAIRSQVRALFLPSTTANGTELKSFRELGVSSDKNGQLVLDETRLGTVLTDRFDEVVTLLTNNENLTTGTLISKPSLPGQSRNAIMALANMVREDAPLDFKTQTATDNIKAQERQLERLQERMNQMLDRYVRQFAAMESLVGQTNSLKTSLKSSFEGMMASYTNK